MKTLKSLIAIAYLAIFPVPLASAQNVPLAISYQALLVDDSGSPLADVSPQNYPVVFRIYDSVLAGDLLWSESQNISVFKGSFSTLLGTGDDVTGESRPPLDTVFNEKERYLEIIITDGGTEKTFTPRQQMVSAPFAFRSSLAEKVVVIDDDAVGAAQIDDKAVDLNALADAVVARLQPAGSVGAWAGLPTQQTLPSGETLEGVPVGWLLCDGRSVTKADYPELFKAIGYIYGGSGDNFNVPDYQGYFLRGQSISTAQDPDRNSRNRASIYADDNNLLEGSDQVDQFKSHNHNSGIYNRLLAVAASTGHGHTFNGGDYSPGEPDIVENGTIKPAGGNETRPKNRYVHYIIKAH